MPSTVPSIDGLAPLWDFAISIGAKESDVIAALKNDGVHVLEISILGKRVHFVDKVELGAYVARNAAAAHKSSAPKSTLLDHLDRQAEQIQALQRRLAELMEARGQA